MQKSIVKMNSYLNVALEGHIGAGKSSLFKMLEKAFDDSWCFLDEPVELWQNIKDDNGDNLLMLYYNDQERWSFPFQLTTNITRINDIINAYNKGYRKILSDRSVDSNTRIFGELLKNDGKISTIEYQIYNQQAELNKKLLNNTETKYIYMRCKPEVARFRINKRNRGEESGITDEYIEKIDKLHEEWLIPLSKSNPDKCLVLDVNDDFLDKEEEFVCKIKKWLNFD